MIAALRRLFNLPAESAWTEGDEADLRDRSARHERTAALLAAKQAARHAELRRDVRGAKGWRSGWRTGLRA